MSIIQQKSSVCQVCQKDFSSTVGLLNHTNKIHHLSSQEYFDKYFKLEDEDICVESSCNNITKFKSFTRGYRKYCSSKCSNANSEKIKLQIISYKKTVSEHPEIIEAKIKTYRQTLTDDPSINIRRGNNISKTLSDNPDIVNNRKQKFKNTIKENPSIQKSITEKRLKTIAENPSIQEKISNNISISLRNKYSELYNSNSTTPHYLYIIKHSSKPIIKIGRSEEPEKRIKSIISSIGECKIIFKTVNSFKVIKALEIFLHDHFKNYCKVQPKGVSGRTEWFDECILEEAIDLAIPSS